ncbi:MAG: GDP-D-mannose dehydratase [Microgenomates bacterium 39_7]|nr:MAG: GDP-D-mannose dehydratase [Microgenomates bacterium 39_7]
MTHPNSNIETILITGGTGFAGSHLVDALLASGQKNIHVTSYGTETGHVGEILPSTQIHPLNLTDFEKTKELFEKVQPTQIYQLAALASVGSSFDQLDTVLSANTQIQLSVLSAAQEVCPQSRILSIGTALEYKPKETALKETDVLGPVNPYGVSKVTQEMLAHSFHRQHNLDVVFTRSFNHFGERQAPGFVVADFSLQVAKLTRSDSASKEISVGNLAAKRDFTYVKDIAQAYILLMDKGKTGEIYNVGSGITHSVEEVLQKLISLSGLNIRVTIDEKKFRPIDVPVVLADIEKIKKLGWKASTNIDEALKLTFNYYMNNY